MICIENIYYTMICIYCTLLDHSQKAKKWHDYAPEMLRYEETPSVRREMPFSIGFNASYHNFRRITQGPHHPCPPLGWCRAPSRPLLYGPAPIPLPRLACPLSHGCVFTAGDRPCLGCATGERSRGRPSPWLGLPTHPRPVPAVAGGSGLRSAPCWLGAPTVRSTRGAGRPRHRRLPRGRVHCPGESSGWEAGNLGAFVAREHPRGRRLSLSAPPRPAAPERRRGCVWAREGWVLFSPVPPRAAQWCGPGSGLRRSGVRRCQCREVQPSAGAGSRHTDSAMEPHRWLPLEANPDVSARLGGWVLAEGGREDGGGGRARGRSGLSIAGWGVAGGGREPGGLLACGSD